MSVSADPRVRLTFARREGQDRTHWLEIEAPFDAEPAALYNDLKTAGWIESLPAMPAHPAYDERTFKPLGYQVCERVFVRHGSDTFRMWSQAEAKAWLPQARGILRRHGFERVPVWRKTLADML